MEQKRSYISILLLSIFILLKVVNLHALEHQLNADKTTESCELCEHYIITNLTNPALQPTEAPQLVLPVCFTKALHDKSYQEPASKAVCYGLFFNKPPPRLV